MGPKHPDYHRFQRYLAQHHYLSYRGPVGENLGYLIRSCAGVDLACLLFGAAAWQCAPRDRWIGWSAQQRAAGLLFIANNSRFLILPWVGVHLASHILSRIARRIGADWQERYHHRLHLLETFVQPDRFRAPLTRRPTGSGWAEPADERARMSASGTTWFMRLVRTFTFIL